MRYALRFLDEVEEDSISAAAWYDERRSGLGDEFLEAFYIAARELHRNPFQYEEVGDGCRRKLLHRFPYAIYYYVEGEHVVVNGLFHCARDPGSTEDELRSRGE